MIAPVDLCARYIDAVITGEILACRYVKLACERQVRDLGRAGDDDFPYFFDETKGNRVCLFIEGLSHIKGKWAGSLITLEDWQCFVLCVAFGWVNEEGNRRYRTTYGEVPRKNAKSTLTSGNDPRPGENCLARCLAHGEGCEVVTATKIRGGNIGPVDLLREKFLTISAIIQRGQ